MSKEQPKTKPMQPDTGKPGQHGAIKPVPAAPMTKPMHPDTGKPGQHGATKPCTGKPGGQKPVKR